MPHFHKILAAAAVVISVLANPISGAWINVTSNLANMQSECGNLCLLSAVPGKEKVIAGIAQKGLWQTTDGGATWTQLGTGAGSAVITNRPGCIVYDPTNADIFWEAGIYNGGGVYKTADGGVTFHQLGNISHNDNVTVDFTDPQRKTLLAAGHEQMNRLYKSIDGGQTWTDIGNRFPDSTSFSRPLIINAAVFLNGCSGYAGKYGMFRSDDSGATFASVGGTPGIEGPSADPLVLANGIILWEQIYNRGMMRSIDNGVSWAQITGYGTLTTSHPVLLPDKSVAALGANKILVSTDAAVAANATWTQVCDALPVLASGVNYAGVIYEPVRGAFYTWNWDCGNVVRSNAIMRFDYLMGILSPIGKSAFAPAPLTTFRIAGSQVVIPAGTSGAIAKIYDLRGAVIKTVQLTSHAQPVSLASSGMSVVRIEPGITRH
jgi:hypothetical protein